MEIPFVDLGAQYASVKNKIDNAITDVLDSSAFIGGHYVADFEKSFADFVGVDHAISCANGTDALEIALEALGLGNEDEVLIPAYTWVSTASAVVRQGGVPVFIDVDPGFYTLDPALLEKAITPKTIGIIAVHFYGLAADMPAIIKIARKHKLFVIEDCAQAHGGMIGKQMIGTFGDVATFSFYPGKNLGAYGDGGAMLTNDKNLAKKCRIIAGLGQDGKHNHVAIGRNSRLDSLQAVILQTKLSMLEEWTARRRWVARQYNMQFADLNIDVQRIPVDYKHVYHLYVIQVDNRDELKEYLLSNGVQTQIHYPKPLSQMDIFKAKAKMVVADKMAGRILSLPIYPEMTAEQINYITGLVKKFLIANG